MSQAKLREVIVSMCNQLMKIARDYDFSRAEEISFRVNLRHLWGNRKYHNHLTVSALHRIFNTFGETWKYYDPQDARKKKVKQRGNSAYYTKKGYMSK